jgi:dipeptidyl-peptidase-4
MLENNQGLKDKLKEYRLTSKTFLKIPNGQGTDLEAWIIRPPDFDPAKKYPVFMTVYGGPGHNTVENQWEGSNYLWYQMLAQKGYIVVSVDNRGTQFRGEEFKKSTYKQLGKLETEDQIAAAKYMAALPYVDASRIGIQGWSYGGYMSSLCITKGADIFKMAIAVAPVTNWRYYDSIYTERFMQTPQENGSGYDDNSPINHVSRLKGKYLLIHGTADDNVHFQNSVEMVNALVKANKQFDLFFYPDKNHGIYGGNTRLHLYNMMTNFIIENL